MVNKAIIIGNLGRDPETRFAESGTTITNISVATSERWTKDGEDQEQLAGAFASAVKTGRTQAATALEKEIKKRQNGTEWCFSTSSLR